MKKCNKYNKKQFIIFLFVSACLIATYYLFQTKTADIRSSASKPFQSSCIFNKAAKVANVEFPPNANMILISQSKTFDFDKDQFTVEFLFKQLTHTRYISPTLFHNGNRMTIILDSGTDGNQNKITLYVGDGNTTKMIVGPELSLNTWHHVAVGFSRTSQGTGTVSLHVDGNTTTMQNSPFVNNLHVVDMGGSYFNGLFDEVRISKKLVYMQGKSSYKVPIVPFRNDKNNMVLLHLDGDLNDSSGLNNFAQANGDLPFVSSDYLCNQTGSL